MAGGETNHGVLTHGLLWNGYEAVWLHQRSERWRQSADASWGRLAINTPILLSSGATLTWAHWGLIEENRPSFEGLGGDCRLGRTVPKPSGLTNTAMPTTPCT